jgi:hypothetical protein
MLHGLEAYATPNRLFTHPLRASNIMTVPAKAAVSRHSRAEPAPDLIGGGNPIAPRLSWTPASAGVTEEGLAFILLEALMSLDQQNR